MRFFMDGSGRSPNAGWSWRNTTLVAGLALLSSLAVGIGAAGGLSVLDESVDPKPPAPAEARARAQVPLPVDPQPPPGGNTAEVTEPRSTGGTDATEPDPPPPPPPPRERPTESGREVPEEPESGDQVDEGAVGTEIEGAVGAVKPPLPESHCPDAPSWPQIGDGLSSLRLGADWRELDLGALPDGWGGAASAVPPGAGGDAHDFGSVPENSNGDERGSRPDDLGSAPEERSSPSWDTGYSGRDGYERLSHRPCDPYRRNCPPMITAP